MKHRGQGHGTRGGGELGQGSRPWKTAGCKAGPECSRKGHVGRDSDPRARLHSWRALHHGPWNWFNSRLCPLIVVCVILEKPFNLSEL